jgi:hypothetical protein
LVVRPPAISLQNLFLPRRQHFEPGFGCGGWI